MKNLDRNDIWAGLALLIAIVTCVSTVFVPEIRTAMRLREDGSLPSEAFLFFYLTFVGVLLALLGWIWRATRVSKVDPNRSVSRFSQQRKRVSTSIILSFILLPIAIFIANSLGKNTLSFMGPKILVAQFESTNATTGVDVARRIENDLRSRLVESGLDSVHIDVLSDAVLTYQQAETVLSNENGSALIWGWYDDLGINIRILFASQAVVREISSGEIPFELTENSTTGIDFVVRNIMPDNISFLSFFVIGQLYFVNNQYELGFTAFNSAMTAIPENVSLENEAVITYFAARELDLSGRGDVNEIVCRYTQAIEQDSEFVEAYSNLGALLARGPGYLNEDGVECLRDIDLNLGDGLWPVDKAIAGALSALTIASNLRPESATIRYNLLNYRWNRDGAYFYDANDIFASLAEWQNQFEEIVRLDPTIFGSHVILGNIHFAQDRFEIARDVYSLALELQPNVSELHHMLGLTYFHLGEFTNAAQAFSEVKQLDNQNIPVRISLAVMDLKSGNWEQARTILDETWSILGSRENQFAVDALDKYRAITLVLRSYSYFQGDETPRSMIDLENAREQGSFTTIDANYSTYLLGLLSLSQGNDALAQTYFSGIYYSEQDLQYSRQDLVGYYLLYPQPPDSSNPAWSLIVSNCAESTNENVSQWGEVNSCLPSDLRERIDFVYTLYTNQLMYQGFLSPGYNLHG